MRHLCCYGLALFLGLGAALVAVPGSAAEKADSEKISKLIEKMSSGRFAERQKAQKELAEIGLPALEALKKAAQSDDPELARRAGELVAKLEKQIQSAKVLAPTKVRLNYKDTPLKEAVADIQKKTGYTITLIDPQNKLADRKVTLDTGETTFWKALDQFCAKAGLTGAIPDDRNPGVPGDKPVPQPLPPVQIQPVRPIKRLPIKKQAQPAKEDKAAPKEEDDADKKKRDEQAKKEQIEKEQVKKERAARAAVQAKIAAQAAQRIKVQVIQAQPIPAIDRPYRPAPPGVILLKDGKAKAAPTTYSGAVRIRLNDKAQNLAEIQMRGAGPKDEILLGLEISPEPKLRWQQLIALRVDKAVDDQGQTLTQAMGDRPTRNYTRWAGVHQYAPLRLKKGEKASKSLKELSGTIVARVLTPAEVHISADDILKAAGKTFKGKQGGSIKINGVDQKDGRLTLKVELDAPANVVPAGRRGVNRGIINFNGGPIRILPAQPPQVVPVPAPAPAPAPIKGKGFQVQVQVAPAQAPQPVQIQIGIGQAGGIAIAPGFVGNTGTGLELLDDKGNAIPMIGMGMSGRAGGGGPPQFEYHMTFQVKKGQKPAKLIFKGSKSVNVEIPFSFKNVDLP